jgi:hypothetical protein
VVDRLNISLNPKRKTDYSSGRSKWKRRTQKGEMEYLKGRQMILFPHPTWRTRPKRRRKEGKKIENRTVDDDLPLHDKEEEGTRDKRRGAHLSAHSCTSHHAPLK